MVANANWANNFRASTNIDMTANFDTPYNSNLLKN
jgi:hypothetical protein